MVTKLALYLSETIFRSCDEFSAGEFSSSCFSTSFPPSTFDQLFLASCFRRVFLDFVNIADDVIIIIIPTKYAGTTLI